MTCALPFRRLLVVGTSVLGLLAGCAHREAPPPLAFSHVWVLPVAPIDRMYTENLGVPVGLIWQSLADHIKSNDFNARMDQTRKAMAVRMTTAIVSALDAQGFTAELLPGDFRYAGAAEEIDPRKLPTDEPVLQVTFDAVGMYSSRFSIDYVPRVNVNANVLAKASKDYLHSETVYYGGDSRGDESWSVHANPLHKWSSFNDMYDHPDDIGSALNDGVDAVAVRIAHNLRQEVRAGNQAFHRSTP